MSAPMVTFLEEIKGGRIGRLVRCLCFCGRPFTARKSDFFSGDRRSCGCRRAAVLARGGYKHGGRNTPTYRSWRNMKARCYNAKDPYYAIYGGRGITVCAEWLEDFPRFLVDMGPKPVPGMSIDRIDNNGNYEPGNCRWATTKEQNRNRSDTVWLEIDGEKRNLSEWVEQYGADYSVVQQRISRWGWDALKALTTPARAKLRA